jgi:hypothetical protein
MLPDGSRRFSYHRTGMKAYSFIFIIFWFLLCIVTPFLMQPRGWESWEFFSSIAFMFLCVVTANAYLINSDIEVNNNGISWLLFNHRWKGIEWGKVDHIRVSMLWGREHRKQICKIYVFNGKHSIPYFLGGGMVILETIHDYLDLKRLIKHQAEKRGIRVEGSDCGW